MALERKIAFSMVAVTLITAIVTAVTMSTTDLGLRVASAFSPDTGLVDTATAGTVTATAGAVAQRKSGGVLPAGTIIQARMTSHVSSRTAAVGDPVSAVTIQPLIVGSKTIYPAGTGVIGYVSHVRPASQTRSAAVLAIQFTRIGNDKVAMTMVSPDLDARARQANTAADIGLVAGGAILGGVLGHQMDHKKGKEVGAVVGGLTGVAAAAQFGANVQLKLNETIVLRLDEDMRLTR